MFRFMLSALRTATLRYDTDTQGTLLTLLLRNFIHYKLYDQADKLVSRTQFPNQAENNLFCEILVLFGPYQSDPIGLFGGSSTFVNGYSKGSATE